MIVAAGSVIAGAGSVDADAGADAGAVTPPADSPRPWLLQSPLLLEPSSFPSTDTTVLTGEPSAVTSAASPGELLAVGRTMAPSW